MTDVATDITDDELAAELGGIVSRAATSPWEQYWDRWLTQEVRRWVDSCVGYADVNIDYTALVMQLLPPPAPKPPRKREPYSQIFRSPGTHTARRAAVAAPRPDALSAAYERRGARHKRR